MSLTTNPTTNSTTPIVAATIAPIIAPIIAANPVPSSLNNATNYILGIYDKLTYYDMYGSSVFIVIVSTIVVLYAMSFSLLMQNKQEIAADWPNQRCKPRYIPFAGYIIEQEGKTAGEYTYENFQFCLQNQMVNMTSDLTKSHVFLLNSINASFTATAEAANNLRGGLSVLRTNIGAFAQNVLQRLANLLAPFLKIFIASRDILDKIQGTLAAGLFTMLGAYYAIQAFIGAFFQIMLVLLLIFIGIIGILWAVPFTWPTALSLSIPVAAFASFFAVMVAVLSKMFNISPIKGLPKMPKSCFDKNTNFTMYNGFNKKIIDIQPGDILADGTKITSKMKLDLNNNRMFSLRGVIVSESHQVKYNDKWIYVKDHPDSIEIHGYKEPFIYCMNTSSKEILLNGLQFLDWDELYDDRLEHIVNFCVSKNKNKNKINKNNIIHRQLDIGFTSDFEIELINFNAQIKDVKNGDILKTGGQVYGLVEIDGTDLNEALGKTAISDKLYHLLSTNKIFSSNGQIINDYNHIIDSIV